MYYELYIDVLFLMNFMMDSILLLSVRTVLKSVSAAGRAFLGGAVGAALTCAVIMLPLPAVIKFLLFHTAVNGMMLTAGLKIKGKREFLKAYLLLYIFSVFLGGILGALRPYMRIGSLYFAAAVSGYYILRVSWKFLAALRNHTRQICEVTVCTVSGKRIRLRALIDTGNVLRDEALGKPVSVIDKRTALKILPDQNLSEGFHYIPYRTVGKSGIMPVFCPEKICVHTAQSVWIEKPVIGICEKPVSEIEEYQMILNPEIIGGIEDGCKSSDAAAV